MRGFQHQRPLVFWLECAILEKNRNYKQEKDGNALKIVGFLTIISLCVLETDAEKADTGKEEKL